MHGSNPTIMLAGASIAIVDDHQIVAQALQLLVDGHGATSEVFTSGEALLKRLPESTWHLILLDLSMPGMSGLEVLEELRSRRCDIAVLVVSMHDNPAYVRRALDLGARGYVRKDASADQLLEAIDKATHGLPAISQDAARCLIARQRGTKPFPSRAEILVLREVLQGHRARDIAVALGISKRTVESHKARLMQYYQVRSTLELIRCAEDDGLVRPPASAKMNV